MDEEQPEHESVARIQTRLKSGESLPKKKKKKERRRNKRNKKSSEGCQIKRRKAKKMLPWMFMPGIESGPQPSAQGRAAVTLAAEGVTDAAGTDTVP